MPVLACQAESGETEKIAATAGMRRYGLHHGKKIPCVRRKITGRDGYPLYYAIEMD